MGNGSVSETEAEILQQLTRLTVLLEEHLEQEKLLQPKLEELVSLLERSKGVMAFFKFCIYIGAPISALVYWAKDHIKL